jgi:hypothetical protein
MGENLISYSEDKGIVSYYDRDGVQRKAEIVRVWGQIGFNEKNEKWKSWVDLCINNSKPNSNHDCNKLYNIKVLYEINCKKNKYCLLSIVTYDEDGRVLYRNENLSSKVHYIMPESVVEKLKNRVCE